jgi:threonyl-tRNA synthetase
MTKIKLVDGTIISASTVEVVNGVLKITTNEYSVEELAKIFQDKNKTNLITLMTESEKESGYKTGFTSFAGINYDADGNKTVELFQPKDVTESRLSNVEGNTSRLTEETYENTENIIDVQAQVDYIAMMTDVEMM